MLLNFGLLMPALWLAGCSYLPSDGPSHRAIERDAAATLVSETRSPGEDYVLVDITGSIVGKIPSIGPGSFFGSFGKRRVSPADYAVGPGDRLQVTIFESSSGGLFSPGDASLKPGNFVTLPAQTVSQKGTISVPYAGDVHVAGHTTQEAGRLIERKLGERAIEPQVVVTFGEQVASSVTIIGETSNKVPLIGKERVLDVLARTGGAKSPGFDMFVTLVRSGHSATVYFPTLVRHTNENILVAPGDLLYVYRQKQKFAAFGAIGGSTQTQGITGLFEFGDERISLSEAIAQAGGLIDERANTEVFVYRFEARNVLESMGVDIARFAGQEIIPTVYRLNYRDPAVFFLSQRFPMRHKDSIYVANADSVELEKFLFHTRAVTGTVSAVTGDIVATRDNIRALRN
ncbi:MAG: polysaccharide biosynthesis/export family protein [Hyphomicrobiaceae bacterium]